jgi:hypothetical protein
MRVATVVCKECGNRERIQILTEDEKRDPQIPKSPIRCTRCGSPNIIVAD